MSMTVHPKRMTGPLSGGSEGATVRVHPLLCAMQKAPPNYHVRPGGPLALPRMFLKPRSKWAELPIVAFLVEHPTAGAILVDTGFDESVADNPKENLGTIEARVHDIDMRQSIPEAIAQRGVIAADVKTVVMTHLHFDHASGISQFPNATFVVSRQEWESASHKGFRDGYRPAQFQHPFDWREIDFTASSTIDSFPPFARAFDLFADGSVRLLFTPGHTEGHCSLLLRLGGGREMLLCGDAAYGTVNIEQRAIPLLCPDAHVYLRSLDEIRRYVEHSPGAVVIPGHDTEAWSKLDAVYD